MSSADLIAQAAISPPDIAADLYSLAHGESVREAIRSCTSCPLHQTAKAPVPFTGTPSPIALIGEAPGKGEDNVGRPFVGTSGRLLWATLSNVGVQPHQVAALNTICCRPPSNDYEVARIVGAPRSCSPHFEAQLAYLGSWVLVLLGNTALSKFMPDTSISTVRGSPRWVGSYYVIPTWHPAYVLRNPKARLQFANDLSILAPILAGERDTPIPASYDPTAAIEFIRPTHLVGLDREATLAAWKKHRYVVVYSHRLADQVVVTLNADIIPDSKFVHLPRYTIPEVLRLRRLKTQAHLRQVHLLKRELGVEVSA